MGRETTASTNEMKLKLIEAVRMDGKKRAWKWMEMRKNKLLQKHEDLEEGRNKELIQSAGKRDAG